MNRIRSFYNLITVAIFVGSLSGYTEHEKTGLWAWLQGDQSEAARLYQEGQQALDDSDWQAAISSFEKAKEADESRADAALYWIAYCRHKLRERTEALQTIRELRRGYPDSRWIKDADALALEIRGARGGQTTSTEDQDMELKLMALNSLMQADPEKAVPLLEEFLTGDQPTKLKQRALFVLAQSGSDRAFEIVAEAARNGAEPDLQSKAIKYLGIHGSSRNIDLLADLYTELSNRDAKKAILHGFMVAEEKERLLALAREEQDPELRGQAIHWLGVMDSEEELWQLYQNESSQELKKKILHALFIGDGSEHLAEVARDRSQPEDLRKQAIHWLGVSDATDELWSLYPTETSRDLKKQILHGLFLSDEADKLAQIARNQSEAEELRKAAIHNLGLVGDTGPVLLEIYGTESDLEIRGQVLHSLFLQEAAGQLIDIARNETDSELKKKAVHWISLIDTDEARDFLMEILRK